MRALTAASSIGTLAPLLSGRTNSLNDGIFLARVNAAWCQIAQRVTSNSDSDFFMFASAMSENAKGVKAQKSSGLNPHNEADLNAALTPSSGFRGFFFLWFCLQVLQLALHRQNKPPAKTLAWHLQLQQRAASQQPSSL